jgi:hypothetical protein
MPIVLGCLSIETFHRALPFRLKLRHLLQLFGCTQKPSLDIIGVPPGCHIAVFAGPAGSPYARRSQSFYEPGQAQAVQMVFQPLTFKPEAGSGEV